MAASHDNPKVFPERMIEKNIYAILGITHGATQEEIKKAARKLIELWHPDRHANKSLEEQKRATEYTQDIVAAAEILRDPSFRAKYDRESSFGARLEAKDVYPEENISKLLPSVLFKNWGFSFDRNNYYIQHSILPESAKIIDFLIEYIKGVVALEVKPVIDTSIKVTIDKLLLDSLITGPCRDNVNVIHKFLNYLLMQDIILTTGNSVSITLKKIKRYGIEKLKEDFGFKCPIKELSGEYSIEISILEFINAAKFQMLHGIYGTAAATAMACEVDISAAQSGHIAIVSGEATRETAAAALSPFASSSSELKAAATSPYSGAFYSATGSTSLTTFEECLSTKIFALGDISLLQLIENIDLHITLKPIFYGLLHWKEILANTKLGALSHDQRKSLLGVLRDYIKEMEDKNCSTLSNKIDYHTSVTHEINLAPEDRSQQTKSFLNFATCLGGMRTQKLAKGKPNKNVWGVLDKKSLNLGQTTGSIPPLFVKPCVQSILKYVNATLTRSTESLLSAAGAAPAFFPPPPATPSAGAAAEPIRVASPAAASSPTPAASSTPVTGPIPVEAPTPLAAPAPAAGQVPIVGSVPATGSTHTASSVTPASSAPAASPTAQSIDVAGSPAAPIPTALFVHPLSNMGSRKRHHTELGSEEDNPRPKPHTSF